MRAPSPSQMRKAMEVLGVNPATSWMEVRRRYRELIATNHPDRGGDEERAKEITEAYQLLKRWWKQRWMILACSGGYYQSPEDYSGFSTRQGFSPSNVDLRGTSLRIAWLINLILIMLGMGLLTRFIGPLMGVVLRSLPLIAAVVGIGILVGLIASLPEPEEEKTHPTS